MGNGVEVVGCDTRCRLRSTLGAADGQSHAIPIPARARAVFLDRDGTLIHNHPSGCSPQDVKLLPGVVEGLRALQQANYRLFVITNQSGVARGYFSEQLLAATHTRLAEMLAAEGVTISDVYYCPHHPEAALDRYRGICTCRKPLPGMLLQAAREHGLDLSSSWMIGDILDDVEAGHRAGCWAILIDVGTEGAPESRERTPEMVARSMVEAAEFILATSSPVPSDTGSGGRGEVNGKTEPAAKVQGGHL